MGHILKKLLLEQSSSDISNNSGVINGANTGRSKAVFDRMAFEFMIENPDISNLHDDTDFDYYAIPTIISRSKQVKLLLFNIVIS